MSDPLEWNEVEVQLNALKPYERNPRTISASQYEKLKASIVETGYRARISVTRDYMVVGGHQRLAIMRELGYETLKVLYPSRELTRKEFERILIQDNVPAGIFDMDTLANDFELEDLRDWGAQEIFDIPPMDSDDGGQGKRKVRCPHCSEEFPVKGNGVNG